MPNKTNKYKQHYQKFHQKNYIVFKKQNKEVQSDEDKSFDVTKTSHPQKQTFLISDLKYIKKDLQPSLVQ